MMKRSQVNQLLAAGVFSLGAAMFSGDMDFASPNSIAITAEDLQDQLYAMSHSETYFPASDIIRLPNGKIFETAGRALSIGLPKYTDTASPPEFNESQRVHWQRDSFERWIAILEAHERGEISINDPRMQGPNPLTPDLICEQEYRSGTAFQRLEGGSIAEIGGGDGKNYALWRKIIGDRGAICLEDFDPNSARIMKYRAAKSPGKNNTLVVQGSTLEPGLGVGRYDAVACVLLHTLLGKNPPPSWIGINGDPTEEQYQEARNTLLGNIHKSLKSQGRLIVVEFHPGPISNNTFLPVEKVIENTEKSGFFRLREVKTNYGAHWFGDFRRVV